MKESTKGYELLIWEASDKIAEVTIARHTSLAIEDNDDEHHITGTFSDLLASGMLCLSLESIAEIMDSAATPPGGNPWHRHITPSFDRVFDILAEEIVAIFKLDGKVLETVLKQILVLKQRARERETELNLAYALSTTTPQQG